MNQIFTYRSAIDGKVGIGQLPVHLHPSLDLLANEYGHMIPNKASTTYHHYYNSLKESNTLLRQSFDHIQTDPFWRKICDGTPGCIMHNVVEMNEIYYSNPKPHFTNMNLYGAAANLIPHRDCVLFNFDGIRFYRVIIGLTENNHDTITEFIRPQIEHKINKGDYMIFDFDKTLHQVKKTGITETPRILLKLHFIVCENCKYSEFYVYSITHFYKLYYYVARYTEQIGTDPTTFMGFFYGLLWEYPFYPEFKYVVFFLFASIFSILYIREK
jgi:hypothetical protein